MNGVRQFRKKFSPNTHILLLLIGLTLIPFVIDSAYAQSAVNVTATTPCFQNYTATGLEMLQNCDFAGDYLGAVTLSFDWVTGGLFPFFVVTVLIVMSYVKYQTGIYPLAIGIVFLPFAAWAYPDEFISYAIAVGAVIGAGAVLSAIIKQTKEY